MIKEIAVSLLLILGCLFCLLASFGLVRMPDLYCRMQSMTKGTTLGVGLIMLAVTTFFASGPPVSRAVAVILFLLVTSPVSAHMIARVAFVNGVPIYKGTKFEKLYLYFKSKGMGITPLDTEEFGTEYCEPIKNPQSSTEEKEES